jgi:hypothetical protein
LLLGAAKWRPVGSTQFTGSFSTYAYRFHDCGFVIDALARYGSADRNRPYVAAYIRFHA